MQFFISRNRKYAIPSQEVRMLDIQSLHEANTDIWYVRLGMHGLKKAYLLAQTDTQNEAELMLAEYCKQWHDGQLFISEKSVRDALQNHVIVSD